MYMAPKGWKRAQKSGSDAPGSQVGVGDARHQKARKAHPANKEFVKKTYGEDTEQALLY